MAQGDDAIHLPNQFVFARLGHQPCDDTLWIKSLTVCSLRKNVGQMLKFAVPKDVTINDRIAICTTTDRHHHPEVGRERDVLPLVPVKIVPVTWAPAFIAIAVSVDREILVIHTDRAAHCHMLFNMTAKRFLFGI